MSSSQQPSETRFPLIVVFSSHWMAMAGLGLVLTAIVLWACLLTVELQWQICSMNKPRCGSRWFAAHWI